MGTEENIKTIQQIYEAFGRGDVGAILEALTDDVDWASETASTAAPWFGPHKGKEQVASFFEAFGSTVEVEDFSPYAFAGNEDDVFAVVRFKGKVRTTGVTVTQELHHLFRFLDGKIYHYRGTEDTAQVEAALRG